MGARGPAKTPTKLQILRGNPGKRSINKNEPQPRVITPDMPADMDAGAQAEWKRLAPELERLGLLTLVDQTFLAAYCRAASELDHCERVLATEGLTYETETGFLRERPEIKIRQMAFTRMVTCGSRFGLSPSDRTRLDTGEKEPTVDEFSTFMSRGKG